MENYIYAAGLFDGEGTVTLTKKSARDLYRSPVISMTSTTYELVLFMKNLFGGHICNHTKKKVVHSQAWSWRATSNKALKALNLMYAYLKEPEKIRRSFLILTKYKELTPRNGKYTDSMRRAKLAFENQFFHPSTPYPKKSKVSMSL